MRIPIALGAVLVAGAATASQASAAYPGANGRIAYQGYQSLGTVNAGGGDREPLLSQGGAVFAAPSWSPDGQRLAFASNRDGTDFEIYVTTPDGATVTPLTTNAVEDEAPTWSPDGQRIAFASDREGGVSRIFVMNRDGTGVAGTASSVLPDSAPAWSPDGSRIAFSRGEPGDIFVMDPDGGNVQPLTSGPADDTNPDWSPDGTRIVFQRDDAALIVMGADGGGQVPLPVPAGARRPAWSPDGGRIVFDIAPELYTVRADGTDAKPITSGGSSTLFSQSPSWQPVPGPPPPPPPPPGPPPPGAVDADGDGVLAGSDCDDADPAIRPGARDRPGDRIDQDCSGRDARFPLLQRRVEAFLATYPAGYTVFTSMLVKPVRKGDRLLLTCKGPGCAFKRKSLRVRKRSAKLSLLRHFDGARLRKGARVRLRIARPGTIGRVTTWDIVAPPKNVRITKRCIRPGGRKLVGCPGG